LRHQDRDEALPEARATSGGLQLSHVPGMRRGPLPLSLPLPAAGLPSGMSGRQRLQEERRRHGGSAVSRRGLALSLLYIEASLLGALVVLGVLFRSMIHSPVSWYRVGSVVPAFISLLMVLGLAYSALASTRRWWSGFVLLVLFGASLPISMIFVPAGFDDP